MNRRGFLSGSLKALFIGFALTLPVNKLSVAKTQNKIEETIISGEYGYRAVFNSVLTDKQIEFLSKDPYQFLRPVKISLKEELTEKDFDTEYYEF